LLPVGNDEPDGGVQTTDTGAAPPVTVGAGYETVALRPVVCTVCVAGHVSLGASVVGGVGPVGLSPQPTVRTAARRAPGVNRAIGDQERKDSTS
jgi:hypothetical protein